MPTTRSAHWHRRRLEVIDRCAEVFAVRGYYGTGIIELCEANGLSKGAIYYYIGSKEQLLASINDRLMDEVMLGADRVERAGGTPPEKLRALGREYLDVMIRFPNHLRVMLHDFPALTGEHADHFRKRRREYEERVETVLADGIRAGDFRPVDVPNAVQAWISSRTSMLVRADHPQPEKLLDTFEDIFVRGLSAQGKIA